VKSRHGNTKDRLGERWLSSEKCWMTIIASRGVLDCDIQFDDGTIVYNRQYDDIKKGYIRNPMHRSVCGVGYLGIGKYLPSINRKCTKEYVAWSSMISRCHNLRFPSYKEITVCEEWHNFQVFAEWFENNYKSHMEGWHLDKDILKKGNKIYSPETCTFVPRDINMLFVKCNKSRGKYPIGVRESGDKFKVECNIYGKYKYLGTFNTIEEAFQAYKIAKEAEIKRVAEIWKPQLAPPTYQVLLNYKVEITD
jgi:hypothetical protein